MSGDGNRRPVGRPPVGPKMTVRLYPDERVILEEMAEWCGVTLSEFVRAAVAEKCERMNIAYASQLEEFMSAVERAEVNA